jgi:hypothetical protein
MSLGDKKSYHSSDGMDVRACMCKNWYEEKDIKESIKKLKQKCKEKWDKGNFVLANVQDYIDEEFDFCVKSEVEGKDE